MGSCNLLISGAEQVLPAVARQRPPHSCTPVSPGLFWWLLSLLLLTNIWFCLPVQLLPQLLRCVVLYILNILLLGLACNSSSSRFSLRGQGCTSEVYLIWQIKLHAPAHSRGRNGAGNGGTAGLLTCKHAFQAA